MHLSFSNEAYVPAQFETRSLSCRIAEHLQQQQLRQPSLRRHLGHIDTIMRNSLTIIER